MKNIFVLGLDDFNKKKLKKVEESHRCKFHTVLDFHYAHSFHENPIDEILNEGRRLLKEFPEKIDGMIWFWDFPVALMGPILCKEFGLKGPSPLSAFKCENKYWSRVEQQRIVPECTPHFCGFNPFDEGAVKDIDLDFPFWIKPVMGFSGLLGFRIDNEDDFNHAISEIKEKCGPFHEAFHILMENVETPDDIKKATQDFFIAEKIIGGQQCTVEGFAFDGKRDIHGIIDSHCYPGRSTFSSYQYPSEFPDEIKERLREKSVKVMEYMDFDNGAFNIEFFRDKEKDKLWLLEINTRISQSHCYLFEMVDGVASHKIPLDVALGKYPQLPNREGKYKVAGKMFLRSFKEGAVTKAPDEDRLNDLEKEYPDTYFQHTVTEGMHLSELPFQDSYSYVLSIVYTAADGYDQLEDKFDEICKKLDIEIDNKKQVSKHRSKF